MHPAAACAWQSASPSRIRPNDVCRSSGRSPRLFRKGLITLLRACNFDVVGEAGSGNEAIEVVNRARPDIVLTHLGLPDMGGVMATQHITAANPEVRVVVITLYDDEESVRNALEAGPPDTS